jgi:hypothetical protein
MTVPSCPDCGATTWSLRVIKTVTTDAGIDPETGIPGDPEVAPGGDWSESQVSCDACSHGLDADDRDWLA